MFEESQRVAEALGDQHAAAVALNDHGRLAYYQGDYAAARSLLEASLVRFQALRPSSGLAATLSSLGQLTYLEGDYAQSRAWSEQGLQVGRQLDDQRAIADALHTLGLSYHAERAIDAARQHYEQCLPSFEALGDRHSIVMTLSSLGSIATLRGDDDTARGYYRAALLVAREAANRRRLTMSLSAVAALIARHDPARAVRLEAAAELSRKRMGVQLASGMQALYDATLGPARASLGEASRAATITNGHAMSLEQAVDEALAWLAAPVGDPHEGVQAVFSPRLLDEVAVLAAPLPAVDAPSLLADAAPPRPGLLTRRERDVAALLARGLTTNREIALALVITEGAAANYVQRVLNRLDLRTRAQVAAWAAEHGLHEEPIGA